MSESDSKTRLGLLNKNESLTVSHIKVLCYILPKGEAYYNQLKDELGEKEGLSNSTVITALKRLKKLGLIEHKGEKRIHKRGRARKIYGATLKGLIIAMASTPNLWKQIDEIAQNNRVLLPLVFGKWDLYRKIRWMKDEKTLSQILKYEPDLGHSFLPFENTMRFFIIPHLVRVFRRVHGQIGEFEGLKEFEVLESVVTYEIYFRTYEPRDYWDSFYILLINKDISIDSIRVIWESLVYGKTEHYEYKVLNLAAEDDDLRTYFNRIIEARRVFHEVYLENWGITSELWEERSSKS